MATLSNIKIYKNILWLLCSNVLPMACSIILLPSIVSGFGIQGFGILMICWSIVGYLNFLDFGIGRSLTQILSHLDNKNSLINDNEFIKTALTASLILGCLGSLILWVLFKIFSENIFTSQNNSSEINEVILYAALMIPLTIVANVIKGIFESQQRFKLTSMLRSLQGLSLFLFPYISLSFSSSLSNAIFSLLISRLILLIIHVLFINDKNLWNLDGLFLNISSLKILLNQSRWMAVTNILGPFLDYLDRFFIMFFLGSAAVSYYVIPFDFVTKFTLIAMSISTVFYPIFSRRINVNRLISFFNIAIFSSPFLLYPLLIFISSFCVELLNLWLGNDFSSKSNSIVIILAAGIFINCYSQIIFALIQGQLRADLTAKLHMLEVILHLTLLILMINSYGIFGASIAWLIRTFLDFLGLLFILKSINIKVFTHALYSFKYMMLGTVSLISLLFLNDFFGRLIAFSFFMFLYFYILYYHSKYIKKTYMKFYR